MIKWLRSLFRPKPAPASVPIEQLKRRVDRTERELEALRVQEIERYRRRGNGGTGAVPR